jgi:hypothetical protein
VAKPKQSRRPTTNRSHRIRSSSDDEMGSMEASTAPENGSAAGGTACNGAGAAPNGGVMERRLRSSAASASWAAHLPLEVGTRVMCRWRDQKLHPVKVIERRKGSSSSSPADYEYYVHYTECKDPPCLASQSHREVSCLGLGFGLFRFGEIWVLQLTGQLDVEPFN